MPEAAAFATRREARAARETAAREAALARIPRQRRAAMAAAGALTMATGVAVGDQVLHQPDEFDWTTTTGSMQVLALEPLDVAPTPEPVETPPTTSTMSVADAREAIEVAAQTREKAAADAAAAEAAEQDRREREARAARERSTAHATPTATPSPTKTKTALAPEPEPAAAPAASGSRADRVIAAAKTKVGMPYVWGGESDEEGGFDCSGLMQWAYGEVGVSLPRRARDQQDATTRVTWSEARAGDLVFWGDPAWHVGLYLGDGMVLVAPSRGDVVKVQALWGDPSVRRVA